MVVPFEPITVMQQFFYDTLRVNPTVLSILGNPPAIRPAFAPDERPDIYITPVYESERNMLIPIGRGVGMIQMRWRLIGWRRGFSQLGLREVMRAVMGALAGSDTSGKMHNFVDSDGIGWAVGVQVGGFPVARPEPGETETWQQIAAFYDVDLRQKE